MAYSNQDILSMSNAGQGQSLFNLVQQGQLSEAQVRSALGDQSVDAFLARTGQQAPAPVSAPPTAPAPAPAPTPAYSPPPPPPPQAYSPPPANTPAPSTASSSSGGMTAQQLIELSNSGGGQQIYDMVRNNQLSESAVRAVLGNQTVDSFLQRTGQQSTGAGGNGINPFPNGQPGATQPSSTTAPPPSGGQFGVGANFNTQVPGGTTQNTDYSRYPTPIPTSPDYVGAANQQGQANLDAAKSTVALSNPNQYNPFGSQTYTIGPDGRPVQTQQFSADQQQRLNDLNSLLPSVTNNIRDQTAKPISSYDFQDVDDPKSFKSWLSPITQDISAGGIQSVADALREREQPRFDRNRQKVEADLIARGFNPGTEAWNERLDDLNRAENDFNLGLIDRAGGEQSRLFNLQQSMRNQGLTEAKTTFDAQMARRGQQVGEAITSRTLPIQEYAALVQAMTPQMPQFQNYQGATVDANPIFDATTAKGIFDLGRYGTSIQGELGTRGIDAQKGSDLFGNVLKMFGL